jgi:hypothetical protein
LSFGKSGFARLRSVKLQIVPKEGGFLPSPFKLQVIHKSSLYIPAGMKENSPSIHDTVGELASSKKFSFLVKEETDFRSVQRENQRWLHVCYALPPALLSRRSGIHDVVPSFQKVGNFKKIEFPNSIIHWWLTEI